MKRSELLLFILLCFAFLFIGCEERVAVDEDPGIDFILTDIEGTWEYPNQNGESNISIEIFTTPTTGIFIKWADATYLYDCHGHGTLEGKVFSYTYGYTSTAGLSAGPASDVVLEVALTFSLKNDRLKVVFSGEGPLDGKVYTTGVLKIT